MIQAQRTSPTSGICPAVYELVYVPEEKPEGDSPGVPEHIQVVFSAGPGLQALTTWKWDPKYKSSSLPPEINKHCLDFYNKKVKG